MTVSFPSVFAASMTTAVTPTPLAEVEAAVWAHYGIAATASPLSSERDELFLLDAGRDERFVLRLANPADDPLVVDMQTHSLEWIAKMDPALPVPRIVRSCTGESSLRLALGGGAARIARLNGYLDGRPLPLAPRSAVQRRAIGAVLARLGLALRDFSDPSAQHVLAWDIQHASCLQEILTSNSVAEWESQRDWALVHKGLSRFEQAVKPQLAGLRSQVIHGDFNPHNILVGATDADSVTGVLDFGDMVHTPLINDLAIAACYHVGEAHPLAEVADIVAGYHAVRPLLPDEIDLLYDLMVTRLCAAVAITEWRARRYPDNSLYILKNTGTAWTGLKGLAAIDQPQARQFLRAACHIK